MDIDSIRALCLSFPHVTEQIQWGDDLLFKVAGKMFAVMPLEPAPVCLSFKCSDENFSALLENEGVIPAPYMARNKWVALERFDALASPHLAELLRESYDLVFAKLPRRLQTELSSEKSLRSVKKISAAITRKSKSRRRSS